MNRRTALGAIAASPVLVASAGASQPKGMTLGQQCDEQLRTALAEKCFIALLSNADFAGDATARAFELADAFNAEAASRFPRSVERWRVL